MGFVLCVPFVLNAGELFRGVFSAEGEVSLSVVRLTICSKVLIFAQHAETDVMLGKISKKHTISIQSPSNVMQFRLSVRVFPKLRAPCNHLIHKFPLRRFFRRERPQYCKQLALVLGIDASFGFAEYVDEVAS